MMTLLRGERVHVVNGQMTTARTNWALGRLLLHGECILACMCVLFRNKPHSETSTPLLYMKSFAKKVVYLSYCLSFS